MTDQPTAERKKPGRKPGGPKLSNAQNCRNYQAKQREKLAKLKKLEDLLK